MRLWSLLPAAILIPIGMAGTAMAGPYCATFPSRLCAGCNVTVMMSVVNAGVPRPTNLEGRERSPFCVFHWGGRMGAPGQGGGGLSLQFQKRGFGGIPSGLNGSPGTDGGRYATPGPQPVRGATTLHFDLISRPRHGTVRVHLNGVGFSSRVNGPDEFVMRQSWVNQAGVPRSAMVTYDVTVVPNQM